MILLVEDNPDHAELLKRSFTRYSPDTAILHLWDGEETLDYLFGRGKYALSGERPLPDLILLDLKLPKIDGLQVLKRIKAVESLRSIPVVMLTSSDTEKDVLKAYKLNVNSYLVKPVEFNRFLDLARELGLYWFRWNKRPPAPQSFIKDNE